MEMNQIIKQAEKNIWQAIEDYGRHTRQQDVIEDISSAFVHTLATDSSWAKQDLRKLFSTSPVWDETLDALVINGTRTHNPDSNRIRNLGFKLMNLNGIYSSATCKTQTDIENAINFFAYNATLSDAQKEDYLRSIKELAPKAYAPGKKLSRVFKSICVAVGVADETAGSEFQRLYAQFADELSSKKLGFKLYVSINPAHFLTMSNPKGDQRGATLTSCHSLNSTDYQYNCGCVGYARDKVSFIVFTVADPSDPESFNNRKTTRQIFAYKPGNGLLMQSRLYNTSGGTHGAQEDSKLYRDLVQREISMLENAANLWKTYNYVGGHEHLVEIGDGFGGYPDWTYSDFDGKVSIRTDHLDDVEPLEIGTYGLCVKCAEEIDEKMYCEDCDEYGSEVCDDCGCRCRETYEVYDERGNSRYVCEDCRDENYTYCDRCEEYHPNDQMTRVYDGDEVCRDCLENYYEQCANCDEWYRRDDMICITDHYGDTRYVCESCADEYETCPHCGQLVEEDSDGCCPNCGCYMDEDEEDDEEETA